MESRHRIFIDKPICQDLTQLKTIKEFFEHESAKAFSFSPLTYAKETEQTARIIKTRLESNGYTNSGKMSKAMLGYRE